MLLFLFSIPYIYDFIVGIVTIVLLWRISEFNEKLKQMRQSEENQKLLNEVSFNNISKMKSLGKSIQLISFLVS
jgi:hypothetical protein